MIPVGLFGQELIILLALQMSFVTRRAISTLIPPKVGDPPSPSPATIEADQSPQIASPQVSNYYAARITSHVNDWMNTCLTSGLPMQSNQATGYELVTRSRVLTRYY